jgi:hypothetical protein
MRDSIAIRTQPGHEVRDEPLPEAALQARLGRLHEYSTVSSRCFRE